MLLQSVGKNATLVTHTCPVIALQQGHLSPVGSKILSPYKSKDEAGPPATLRVLSAERRDQARRGGMSAKITEAGFFCIGSCKISRHAI